MLIDEQKVGRKNYALTTSRMLESGPAVAGLPLS